MEQMIRFTLNGKKAEVQTDPNGILLWVLRDHFGLTGTKYGCGIGFCGACTVLIDGEAVYSCSTPVSEAEGRKVTTIEGLEKNGTLHPVQQAFIENDAMQCGFCTPGMIMTAVSLLNQNPDPSEKIIIKGMGDNLCRCGAHPRIVRAVSTAAKEIKGGL